MWFFSLITKINAPLSCRKFSNAQLKVFDMFIVYYTELLVQRVMRGGASYTDTPRKGRDFYTTWLQTHIWKETPGSDSVTLSVVIMLPTIRKESAITKWCQDSFKKKQTKKKEKYVITAEIEKRRVNTSKFMRTGMRHFPRITNNYLFSFLTKSNTVNAFMKWT